MTRKQRENKEWSTKKWMCFLLFFLCIVVEFGITEVNNFPPNDLSTSTARAWRLAPCGSSPTASSCLLHWLRRSSALKETQGRVEDSNPCRLFYFCLASTAEDYFLFSNKRGKTLPFILIWGTNKVFFFFYSVAKVWPNEWSVLRLFFTPPPSFPLLSQPRPPPVKPSDNSGTDRLATNKEGAGGKEGEFDLFFKRHKIPPAVFLSPCLFPLHKSIYNPPISFPLIEHLTLEKKTSSSRISWDSDWDGLNAPAPWYPSTCLHV